MAVFFIARMRRLPACILAAAALLSLVLLSAGVAHAARGAQTWWMETRLSDTPTGYLREQVAPAKKGGWDTELESKLVLSRMGSRVEVRSLVRYTEAADGSLQTVSAELGTSADTTGITGDVRDGVLHLRTRAGGRTYETQTVLAQPLLGPQAIRVRSRDALRAPGDRIEYSTFAGEFSSVAQVVREVVGPDALELDGASVATVIVRETLDVMPVATLYWLDSDGRALRSRQESPFGTVDNVRATADVQARVADGAELPDETYQNAVARANIRLPRPRSMEEMRVRIDLKREDSFMPAIDGPHQTIVERSDRHAVIHMRRGSEPASDTHASPTAAVQWLQPNAYLQSDHPDVIALAQSLRRPDLGPYAQARVLQDWVATHMAFDAGIALVSASEAVRDRRGTCLAYAVVLTSLARALEIPSRVVMGYIYAANMWGGHAWTEVLVDDQWVALDAAVWRAGPADAARIGVTRTSLEQGMATGLAALSQLYGNERIRVLDYTHDGNTVRVPADAAPYTADARDYDNPWLGIAFRAPQDFTLAEVDIIYPRSDIAVLRNPSGARIVLQQRSIQPGERDDPAAVLRDPESTATAGSVSTLSVAGRPAWFIEHEDSAAAVWLDDSDLWIVRGQGDGVDSAINDLLKELTLR